MAVRQKPQSRRNRGASRTPPASLWLYGRHAVDAALKNPARPLRRVLATQNALDWLGAQGVDVALLRRVTPATGHEIDALAPPGAVHQGVLAQVDDLPRARLKDVCADPKPGAAVIVLDQITDPQNIGAVFRSATAFGARAVIVQERRTPPLSGALAKAAAGAIEVTPCVGVVNIARALEALCDLGYHCAGLAGEAQAPVDALPRDTPVAIVLGAEGAGLRKRVAETCAALYRIPISGAVESLNVSNAAAIALYAANRSP